MESKLVIFYLFIFCLWRTLTQNYLSKEVHLLHYRYLRCFFLVCFIFLLLYLSVLYLIGFFKEILHRKLVTTHFYEGKKTGFRIQA